MKDPPACLPIQAGLTVKYVTAYCKVCKDDWAIVSSWQIASEVPSRVKRGHAVEHICPPVIPHGTLAINNKVEI